MLSSVIVAAALIGGAEEKPAAKGVEFFEGTYDEALARAKERKLPLFVDLFAAWCGPCKDLEEKVFADPAVAAFMNSRLVAVKLDAEEGEGPDLKKRFDLPGCTTGLIIDPATGKEIDRLVGFAPPKEYLKDLAQVLGGSSLADLEKKAKASPKDLGAWLDYAKRLDERRRKGAVAAWKKVAALDPKDGKGKRSQALLALARISAIETQDPKPLIDFAAANDGKPPALEAHRIIAAMLSRGPVEGDEEKQLFASLEYLVTHGKRDPETLNEYAWALVNAGRDVEKALSLAEEALKAKPDDPSILDTAAACLHALGRKDEAIAMQKKAIAAADPKDKMKLEILKRRLAELEKEGEEKGKKKSGKKK